MDKSPYIISSVNDEVFEFTSTGKSNTLKQVVFDEIDKTSHLYNVGLCTVLSDGRLDYEDNTNNGDVVSVFLTVINCIKAFIKSNPDSIIYFRGNTAQKNPVYSEILRRHYDEFSIEFRIFVADVVDGMVI